MKLKPKSYSSQWNIVLETNMSMRARLASNAAQFASASAENEKSEQENEVMEDESTVTNIVVESGWKVT